MVVASARCRVNSSKREKPACKGSPIPPHTSGGITGNATPKAGAIAVELFVGLEGMTGLVSKGEITVTLTPTGEVTVIFTGTVMDS